MLRNIEVDKQVFHCFIDFSKAFDLVWHEGLWQVLKSYGVNPKLIRVLRTLYEQETSTVTVNGRRSEWFKANVGTRQGDPISPRAFITFLERLMDGTKELPEKGVTVHGQRVWNLRFADDIDLIDKSPAGIQETIDKISEDSKR